MTNRIGIFALCGLLGLGMIYAASALAAGHVGEDVEKAIKARKADMRLRAFNLGILGAMAKGKREYDATLANELAGNLGLIAGMTYDPMWPKGSGEGNGDIKTRAKDLIWDDYSAFVAKREKWIEASKALAKDAGKGLESLQAAVGATGKSCKGCHKEFRAPKKK